MSDGGGAELAVDCDIATLGAKGGAHRNRRLHQYLAEAGDGRLRKIRVVLQPYFIPPIYYLNYNGEEIAPRAGSAISCHPL